MKWLTYIKWRIIVWIHCRRMSKAILSTLHYGSVRDIRSLCEVARKVAMELDSPELLDSIDRADKEAERLVLKRKWSWRIRG